MRHARRAAAQRLSHRFGIVRTGQAVVPRLCGLRPAQRHSLRRAADLRRRDFPCGLRLDPCARLSGGRSARDQRDPGRLDPRRAAGQPVLQKSFNNSPSLKTLGLYRGFNLVKNLKLCHNIKTIGNYTTMHIRRKIHGKKVCDFQ